MGSVIETSTTLSTSVYGSIKFTDPDLSVGPYDRAFLALPPPKDYRVDKLPLHSYRTEGPASLDVQGFTLVNHKSSVSGERWFERSVIEDTYIPEVQELVKKATGAKSVVALNGACRRRLAQRQDESVKNYLKPGQGVDPYVANMNYNEIFISGMDENSNLEPVRGAHCDYTLQGLKGVIRHTRPDVTAAAHEVLAAQDRAASTNQPYDGPRFSAYSIWRPLKTVRRDPLALCDATSMDPHDLVAFDYRAPCPDTGSGNVLMLNAYSAKPAQEPERQRWFWVPEQTPEEVWIIKLADSEAEKSNGKIAGGVAHCSPVMDDESQEQQPPRESFEIRVACFW